MQQAGLEQTDISVGVGSHCDSGIELNTQPAVALCNTKQSFTNPGCIAAAAMPMMQETNPNVANWHCGEHVPVVSPPRMQL